MPFYGDAVKQVRLFSSARFENLEWKNAGHEGFPMLCFIPVKYLLRGQLNIQAVNPAVRSSENDR